MPIGRFHIFLYRLSWHICERPFQRDILSFWYCWGPIQSRIWAQALVIFLASLFGSLLLKWIYLNIHMNCFPNFSSDLVCSFESYFGPPPPPVVDYCGRGGANCRCFLYNKINIPTIIVFSSSSSVKLDIFHFLDTPASQERTLFSGYFFRIISKKLK